MINPEKQFTQELKTLNLSSEVGDYIKSLEKKIDEVRPRREELSLKALDELTNEEINELTQLNTEATQTLELIRESRDKNKIIYSEKDNPISAEKRTVIDSIEKIKNELGTSINFEVKTVSANDGKEDSYNQEVVFPEAAENIDVVYKILTHPDNIVDCLNLYLQRFDKEGIRTLASILKDPNNKIEVLHVGDCGLTKDNIHLLTDALNESASKVKELDIGANDLGPEGAEIIAKIITYPHPKSNLKKLNITNCKLGLGGVQKICNALKERRNILEELICNNNGHLGRIGGEMMADILRDPDNKLKSLDFAGNDIGDVGINAFYQALKSSNCHLKNLGLFNSNIESAGRQLAKKMEQENPGVKIYVS